MSETIHQPAAAPAPAFDRKAVITIQGGGVYGLNLLGQLQGLLDERIEPFALAGTSAGAIVATLFWAGLSPEMIRDHFASLAGSTDGLTSLLGPIEKSFPKFDYKRFRNTIDRYKSHIDLFKKDLEYKWSEAEHWPRRFMNWTLAIPAFCRMAWEFRFPFRRLASERGVFPGQQFEIEIDNLLRKSPLLQHAVADGSIPPPVGAEGGRLLTFGDFRGWTDAGHAFFGPLFLTVTDLVSRELELIEFPDPRYYALPVARAVRASAGFPVFFRPVNETYGDTRYASYVDGGVICNFPAFVFADTFRTWLLERQDRADYVSFAARTWVHIGLQLGNGKQDQDPKKLNDPTEFLKAMLGLAMGGSRNELERRLAGVVSRSIPVELPPDQFGGPKNILDIHELKPEVVRVMFHLGRTQARTVLAAQRFDLPDPAQIVPDLGDLVARAALALGDPANATLKLRANVFVPQGEDLILRYSLNMDDPAANPDRDMVFRLDQGLSGFCFVRRVPLLCNLALLARVFQPTGGPDDPATLFGMDAGLQGKVRADRTWLMSVPIFDPYTLRISRPEWRSDGRPVGPYHTVLETTLDGAVFGVLNLDASLSYSEDGSAFHPNPVNLANDPRVKTVRDIMVRTAITLGGRFSASYPGQKAT